MGRFKYVVRQGPKIVADGTVEAASDRLAITEVLGSKPWKGDGYQITVGQARLTFDEVDIPLLLPLLPDEHAQDVIQQPVTQPAIETMLGPSAADLIKAGQIFDEAEKRADANLMVLVSTPCCQAKFSVQISPAQPGKPTHVSCPTCSTAYIYHVTHLVYYSNYRLFECRGTFTPC